MIRGGDRPTLPPYDKGRRRGRSAKQRLRKRREHGVSMGKRAPLQTVLWAPEARPSDRSVQEALLKLEQSWVPVTTRSQDSTTSDIKQSLSAYDTPLFLRPPGWFEENEVRAREWAAMSGTRKHRNSHASKHTAMKFGRHHAAERLHARPSRWSDDRGQPRPEDNDAFCSDSDSPEDTEIVVELGSTANATTEQHPTILTRFIHRDHGDHRQRRAASAHGRRPTDVRHKPQRPSSSHLPDLRTRTLQPSPIRTQASRDVYASVLKSLSGKVITQDGHSLASARAETSDRLERSRPHSGGSGSWRTSPPPQTTLPAWRLEAEQFEHDIQAKEEARERRYQKMRRRNIARAKAARAAAERAEAERLAAIEAARQERIRQAALRKARRRQRRDDLLNAATSTTVAKAKVRIFSRHATARRHGAAIRIQALRRGYVTRRQTKRQYDEFLQSLERHRRATVRSYTQSLVSRIMSTLVCDDVCRWHAATKIQRIHRGYCTRVHFRRAADERRSRVQTDTALAQSLIRSIHASARLDQLVLDRKLQTAVTNMQRIYRGYTIRRRFEGIASRHQLRLRREACATTIQRHWRGYLTRRQLHHKWQEMSNAHRPQVKAAITIQVGARRKLAKRRTADLRKEADRIRESAAVSIQKVARGRLARKRARVVAEQKREARRRTDAVIDIQRLCRGYLVRKHLDKLVEAVRQYQIQRDAAIVVQASYRGFRVRRVATVFEQLAIKSAAQRKAIEVMCALAQSCVAMAQMRVLSSCRTIQCVTRSMFAAKYLQAIRTRRLRQNRKRIMQVKLRHKIVSKMGAEAKRKKKMRRRSFNLGKITRQLAKFKNRARSITHTKAMNKLHKSAFGLYEAIYHCVNFMYRGDDLESPLMFDSATGKASEAIRLVELQHFFTNGSDGELDEMAAQLLEFCKKHIAESDTAQNHADTGGESKNDAATVPFDVVFKFFEQAGKQRPRLPKAAQNGSMSPSSADLERLTDAEEMCEYMHSVVEMCEATNYDDPGLDRSFDVDGDQTDAARTDDETPPESEAYSTEQIMETASSVWNMLVSFKGTVLDGDSTSGLLRQHLATEFEDDDIVMYLIGNLVKGLDHPDQTKQEKENFVKDLKAKGISDADIDKQVQQREKELQEKLKNHRPLPVVEETHFIEYFARSDDRVEAMNVLQYMTLRLEDHDDDFLSSDSDDDNDFAAHEWLDHL